jgi:hypothetical protein
MLSLPFSVAWIGAAIAIAQTALLLWHLWRKYPGIPKRVPLGLRLDGRPRALASKSWLWLTPALLAAVIAVVCASMILTPPPGETHLTLLFVFFVIAEVAWFVGWTIDRQIELARGMTHRIAPTRMLLTFFPVIATIVITLALAVTQTL